MGQAYNSGNENEASENLSDFLSVVTKPLQDSYSTTIKTPTADYSTITAVISRDSYQETTALLSRDYRTLISKIIEYLSFILLCTLVALLGATTCYLYFKMKTLLKMAETSINDLLPEVSYDPPKSDMK